MLGGEEILKALPIVGPRSKENVTDEDYRTHGSGLNRPGRNFVIGFDPNEPRLFHVAGLGGHGVTASYAVGRHAAEAIMTGPEKAEVLQAIRDGRPDEDLVEATSIEEAVHHVVEERSGSEPSSTRTVRRFEYEDAERHSEEQEEARTGRLGQLLQA